MEDSTSVVTHPTSLYGKNILLIDDVEDMISLYRQRLEAEGAAVKIYRNGSEAVESVATGAQFDAIVMDLNMPIMDGHSAALKIRSFGYSGPIVALTAYPSLLEKENSLHAGFDDYVSKSAHLVEFIQVMQKWTGKK